MRTMITYLCVFMAVITLMTTASADSGVELWLSKSECRPGDVVELRASMTRNDFAEFEIKLPRDDSLYLVSHEQGPVSYHDGVYSQESTWVFQPTRAGTIELDGIKAVLSRGASILEHDLPPVRLLVKSYQDVADSFAPEPLPMTVRAGGSGLPWALVGGILAAIVLWVLVVARAKAKVLPDVRMNEPGLDDLRVALESGVLSPSLIERVLVNERVRMPAGIREALERVVYGVPGDREILLEMLRKEGLR